MSKSLKLLLIESVDNLGIVGDVVKVRAGYARNYLLPRGYATEPSDDLLKQLASKRAEAQKAVAETRKQREAVIEKLTDFELSLTRSCNDQGILYGAVSQLEISEELVKQGFSVRPRDVRMSQTFKRVGAYDVQVKYESDLATHIKVVIHSDRPVTTEARDEMDFDNEGNLVEKSDKPGEAGSGDRPRRERRPRDGDRETAAAEKPAKEASDKPAKKKKGDA